MKKIAYILVLAACFNACTSVDEPVIDVTEDDNSEVNVEFTTSQKVIAQALKEFDINYVETVMNTAELKGKNLVCSPISATVLLALTANTEDAEIAKEINSVLGYDNTEQLNQYCQKIMSAYPKADASTDIKFANSIWYSKDFTLNPALKETTSKYFDAETFSADFKAPGAKTPINAWVNEKTQGWIPFILELDPKPKTAAIFIDALYFKSLWANPFDKKNTATALFNGSNSSSEISMMYNDGLQHYAEGNGFKAVKLEFGNGAFEAVFVLPNNETDCAQLLTKQAIKQISEAPYADRKIELYLPKFKLADLDKIEITEILKLLGVNKLYESKRVNNTLFTKAFEIESAHTYQKTAIEINETGAEGAAVTWHEILYSSGSTVKPKLKFDRPFVFFINHTSTGACLFAGRVEQL